MTVKAMSAKAIRVALNPLLDASPHVLAAWHYGSSLRSDFRPGTSDIDILLVVHDDASIEQYEPVCGGVRACVPGAEVTVLRLAEVTAGIHPGWSRHFFINVSRTGLRLYGPDLLAPIAAPPLELSEAYQRLVELTQRARLVCLNPSKAPESTFWLAKYQHWVPLCLMELLELAGAPEDRLQLAQQAFLTRFPSLRAEVAFPYASLRQVTDFLEQLIRWVPTHAQEFDSIAAVGRPHA